MGSWKESALGLRVDAVAGEALAEADVEQMWRLRASIFQLKPTPHLAEQYASFARRVRMGQRNLLARDATGRVRAIFSCHWRWSPDRRQLWFLPEYGFVDPAFHGSPIVAAAVLAEAVRLLALARGSPIWFAGIGYPRSFQSLSRMFGQVWTLADPGCPPAARAVLTYLHETFAGEAWDRERHWVRLPTLPEPPPPLERPRSEPWRRFERICPDWSEGYGLGLAAEIRARTLPRLLGDVLARTWRRARGRRQD